MSTDNRSDGKEKVVQIRRCSCVVKGGRRFSFTALVVNGDGKGGVSYGYGKATEVPLAVDKANKNCNRHSSRVNVTGTTIPHAVVGRYGAARVLLMPARPGTGVIAGASVRAVVEAAGIHDILTTSRGSNNPMNLVKATINGLEQLRTREDVARLRGVNV